MHFGRQDVTQETPDELDPVESEEFFATAAGPVFPSEGDMGVVDFDDSTVSDGGSSDVSAEVFYGGGPGANGLDVDAPVFEPNCLIDLPLALVEVPAHGLFKCGSQHRQMKQEVFIFDAANLSVLVQSRAGDDKMEVGMEEELLVPGVKHGGKAADSGLEAFLRGELVGQGAGGGGEEQVEAFPRQGAKKQIAQLTWQGEGDHKVRSGGEFFQLALDPGLRGSASALRTGFVVATVPGEMQPVAIRA